MHSKCEWRDDPKIPNQEVRTGVGGTEGQPQGCCPCHRRHDPQEAGLWACAGLGAHSVATEWPLAVGPHLFHQISKPSPAPQLSNLCRRKPGLEHLLKDLRDFLLPLGFVIRICKRLQQNYMLLYNKKSSTKLKGEEPTGEVCPLQREQRVYVKKLLHYHLSAPFPLERTKARNWGRGQRPETEAGDKISAKTTDQSSTSSVRHWFRLCYAFSYTAQISGKYWKPQGYLFISVNQFCFQKSSQKIEMWTNVEGENCSCYIIL